LDHYLLGVFTKLKRAIREHSHRSHHSGLVGQLLSAESSANSSFVPVRDKHISGMPIYTSAKYGGPKGTETKRKSK